jgi:hypothetical protein
LLLVVLYAGMCFVLVAPIVISGVLFGPGLLSILVAVVVFGVLLWGFIRIIRILYRWGKRPVEALQRDLAVQMARAALSTPRAREPRDGETDLQPDIDDSKCHADSDALPHSP